MSGPGQKSDPRPAKARIAPKPYVDNPTLGPLFHKKGVYDGKLFHANDKITYTFIDDRKVVSIHFDKRRSTIFYNGHSLENLEVTEQNTAHLDQLRHALSRSPGMHAIYHAYCRILKGLLQNKKTYIPGA